MRVVLYTKSYFLDEILSAVPELAKACDLHVIVEIPPEGWNANMLPTRPADVESGVRDLGAALGPDFPAWALCTLSEQASLSAAVFDERRSIGVGAAQTALSLARHIRKLQPDVIHLNGDTLRFAYAAPLLRRIPIVLSVHDAVLHSGEGGAALRRAFSRRVATSMAKSLIVHNTRVTSGPALDEARARGIAIRQANLGPYDVYRAYIRGADVNPSGSGHVLLLGRLSPYKGLEAFADAAARAAKEVADARFLIAGAPIPGYEPPRSRSLPNGCRLDVEARHLSSREVAELVAGARFVVLPYTDASQSGVVLTAYGLGRPVIATDVGGLPDYVVDGTSGCLVEAGDARALAQAMVRLYSSDALLEKLERGVATVVGAEVSWARFTSAVIDEYRTAVAEPSSQVERGTSNED